MPEPQRLQDPVEMAVVPEKFVCQSCGEEVEFNSEENMWFHVSDGSTIHEDAEHIEAIIKEPKE